MRLLAKIRESKPMLNHLSNREQRDLLVWCKGLNCLKSTIYTSKSPPMSLNNDQPTLHYNKNSSKQILFLC